MPTLALASELGKRIKYRHGVFGGLEPHQRHRVEREAQGLTVAQAAAAAVAGHLPVTVRARRPPGFP